MAETKQARVVRILVDSGKSDSEIKKISNEFAKFNKTAKTMGASLNSAAGSLATFRNLLGVSIAGIGLRELAQMADSFQLLRDRISVFAGSKEAAVGVLNDIATSAAYTKTSIESLAISYNRIALATKDLGISSDAVLGITTALQQTFRLSGATIAEATAATIQLSQGLASGQLRGQELRSVLEQNAVIGGILAEKLGITRGQLIKFAESGKITSAVVIEALSENFEKLNSDAGKLGTTIEQAVTVAFDKFKLKLDELNREFGISSKITKGIEFLSNNFETLGYVLSGLAVTIIPKLLASFGALVTLIVANPITAILVGLTSAIVYLANTWDESLLRIKLATLKIIQYFKQTDFKQLFKDLAKQAGDYLVEAVTGASKIANEVNDKVVKPIEDGSTTIEEKIKSTEEALKKYKKATIDAEAVIKKQKDAVLEAAKSFEKLQSAMGPTMAQINQEVLEGTITVSRYNETLKKIQIAQLNKDFREGKKDVAAYHAELVKIGDELQPGNALYVGTSNYINQVGSLSQNIANGITQTFSRLEDSIVEFTKKGKFEFKKFAYAVLEDINRIIIRALIVRPIAQGILSGLSPTPAGATGGGAAAGATAGSTQTGFLVPAAAKGAAFDGVRANFFASGGVVDQPTMFRYGGSNLGVMGEAGPEAILPLKRGPTGELGVAGNGTNVQVNIINQAGVEVSTQSRTDASGDQVLDVLIVKKVQEAINRGQLDRTFNQTYGLNRRGN